MIHKAPKARITSLLAKALKSGRLILGASTGPRWKALPAAPESVSQARRFAVGRLAAVAEVDPDHVDDVVLLVSELITNAVREVADLHPAWGGRKPVRLGVAVHERWTRLYAVDTVPALPRETHGGLLAGSGRGIPIIRGLAAMTWVEQGANDKTIHVVVTRTGVELTSEDKQSLGPRSVR